MQSYFKITTNKPPLSYRVGEEICIFVRAYNCCNEVPCRYFRFKLQGDDGQSTTGLGHTRPGEPFVLKTSCARPGFLHLNCVAYNENNGPDPTFDPYDGGVGVEPERLEYCDAVPQNYDEFWQQLQKKAEGFPLQVVSRQPITAGVPQGFEAFDIQIKTPFGRPASGILTLPKGGKSLPLTVNFCGYGIGNAVVMASKGMIHFCVNAHGYPNNLPPTETYEKYRGLLGYGFEKSENADPKTAYWYGMMLRDLIAVQYAKTLQEWNQTDLVMEGGSQGAFQATHMAAKVKGVTFLNLYIPWFCNLNAENKGYLHGWRPEFTEGLRYYDTAAAATRVPCPVKITAYLGDYVCPPSTVMVLYQSFRTAKGLDFIQGGTHTYRPPEVEAYRFRSLPQNPESRVEPGLYRHFKGSLYRVLGAALNSETGEEQVLYRLADGSGPVWSRPQYMFHEIFLNGGKVTQRFCKEAEPAK